MHSDNLSYANNFEDALRGLLDRQGQPSPPVQRGRMSPGLSVNDLRQAFDLFLRWLNEKGLTETVQEFDRPKGKEVLPGAPRPGEPPPWPHVQH